jgi:hypothetical protein
MIENYKCVCVCVTDEKKFDQQIWIELTYF